MLQDNLWFLIKLFWRKNFGAVHVARNIVIFSKIAPNRKISEQWGILWVSVKRFDSVKSLWKISLKNKKTNFSCKNKNNFTEKSWKKKLKLIYIYIYN